MDIADQCDQQNEIAHKFDILASRKPEGPVANGKCHFCGEDVPANHRWCDRDCRDSWSMRQQGIYVD